MHKNFKNNFLIFQFKMLVVFKDTENIGTINIEHNFFNDLIIYETIFFKF